MSKNCQLILMLGTISLTSNLAFATTFLGATTISKKSYTDSITAHGSFNGSYLKLQSITVNGTLKLNNSSIDGALEVKGTTEITNVMVNGDINTNGSAKLENVTAANINTKGTIDLINSSVGDVTCNEAVLVDSHTKNITITSSKANVILRLTGKTTVDGLINFTNNNGVVIISNRTNITKGIKGGKIQKETFAPQIGPIVNGKEVRK